MIDEEKYREITNGLLTYIHLTRTYDKEEHTDKLLLSLLNIESIKQALEMLDQNHYMNHPSNNEWIKLMKRQAELIQASKASDL